MKQRVRLPGFTYDARRGVVHLTVCIAGTAGATRRKRTVPVTDRDHAVEEWRKFRTEMGLRRGKATAWTLRTYVAAHEKKLTATLSPAAAKSFRLDVGRIVSVIGEVPLSRLTDADAKDLAVALSLKFASFTVNHVLSSLRKVLNDAVARRELGAYPLPKRLPVRKAEPLSLELSDDERLAFLAAFDDEAGYRRMLASARVERIDRAKPVNAIPRPDGKAAHVRWAFFRAAKPLFVVALETGLSRSDLLALTWGDVAGDVLTLRRQKTDVEAVVPISDACRAALEEVKSRAVVGTRIFLGPHGRPLCVSQLQDHLATAKRIAGITRRLRFHDLRHTFASRLASRGVPLQVIARALGHSSTRTTERYARPGSETVDLVRAALKEPTTAPATARSARISNA